MSRILVAVSSPYAAGKVAECVSDLAKRMSAEVLVVPVEGDGGEVPEIRHAGVPAALFVGGAERGRRRRSWGAHAGSPRRCSSEERSGGDEEGRGVLMHRLL